MKRLILILSLLPASLFAQNSLQSFFDKYAGKEGFTTVKISPKAFQLIASADVDDETMKMLADITGLNVLVYEPKEDKPTGLGNKLYDESKALISSGYDELMSVKDEGTDLKILAKSAGEGIINDLLIVGKDDGEFVYVNVTGKMDIKKLSSLSKCSDLKGLEHLKDLDDSDKK